ncbi:Hypothetical protein GLP15_4449 [Giardia lamblia P15]|uniref:Uncharacterized protein n=1 Tax=Giardia intestinalis (strain P15) TaxID=658858 RepID=E1F5L6_GIAIA|nr:Hypothetical protein GLP15_4449 [Giardia lamblia P15]
MSTPGACCGGCGCGNKAPVAANPSGDCCNNGGCKCGPSCKCKPGNPSADCKCGPSCPCAKAD